MGSEKGAKKFFKSKLFSLIVLLAAIVVIFSIWALLVGEKYATVNTIISIGDLMIVTSFLAIGAGMLMVAGNLDLSSAAIGAFSCVLMAACLKYWAVPTGVAIIIALIGAIVFGIINGILVNEFNFASFIATMAMASVAKGAMQFVSVDPTYGSPTTINVSNEVTKFIGTYKIGGVIPFTLVIALLAFIIYGLILSKTKFGMQMYLVGGNPNAARLSGINPKKISYILFANSAFLGGVAGVIYMGRQSQGDLNALQLNQFTGLTAAILGGISFGGGTGNMAGVFVGLLILNAFDFGTVIVHFSSYWTTVLTGLLLLVALTMDYYSAKKARKALA